MIDVINSGGKPFGLGVIGMGGFAIYAAQQFLQHPGVKLVGIAGSTRAEAVTTARRFGAEQFATIDELLASPDVDIIYIASPPFLHYPQSLMALAAGKHVVCEKPLAIDPAHGRELVEKARAKNLLMVTNLMLRYAPLVGRVKQLIDQKLLGELLHGYFENYAIDEGLGPDHWFWDREKSGGIFIEHGVHFFDMVASWIGNGEVVASQAITRPAGGDRAGRPQEEQVNCTVRYGNASDGFKLFNFYHGFTQTSRMEAQEMRLTFERGYLTLHEWVPTRLVLRGLLDETSTHALLEIFPLAQLDVDASFGAANRSFRGRGKTFDAYQQIELTSGLGDEKQHLYSQALRRMFADQLAAIRNPGNRRTLIEEDGLQSLITAASADRMARPAM